MLVAPIGSSRVQLVSVCGTSDSKEDVDSLDGGGKSSIKSLRRNKVIRDSDRNDGVRGMKFTNLSRERTCSILICVMVQHS